MDASLPQDWTALCLLVFALGLRHGFDADHLAAIDAMTRYNARQRPRLAKLCGLLFSLGHGAVVLLVALSVSAMAQRWVPPAWLESVGAAASIVILAALGCANLKAVLTAHPAQLVRPVGIKAGWLGRLGCADSPAAVAAVGALFALSFDTLSQAALFAATAGNFGGWRQTAALALLFTLGMLVTDAINGLWIARLLRRADQRALRASRAMGLIVAGASLLVAGLGAARWVSPAVADWSEGKELLFGAAVVGLVLLGYFAAVWLTRRPAPQTAG